MKKSLITIFSILCSIIFVFGLVACSNNNSSTNPENNDNKYAILQDDYLEADLKNALNEIKVLESKMSKLSKAEDWAGGAKYKFIYGNKLNLFVYCNTTSTVESINLNDEKIYYRGYESYDINNYIYDDTYTYNLVFSSEDLIKSYLNYPNTANFPASALWNISRNNNIYTLTSHVKASNAFGIENQYSFTTSFYVTNTEIKCIFIKFDGDIKFNIINQYKETTDRKQVQPKYPNKSNNENIEGINLVYGQLGSYGKYEDDNGYQYIAYYVPSGKYTAINNANFGTIFVSNNIDTQTYTFSSGSTGKTKEIIIPNNYYIELSMNTNITLQLIIENN